MFNQRSRTNGRYTPKICTANHFCCVCVGGLLQGISLPNQISCCLESPKSTGHGIRKGRPQEGRIPPTGAEEIEGRSRAKAEQLQTQPVPHLPTVSKSATTVWRSLNVEIAKVFLSFHCFGFLFSGRASAFLLKGFHLIRPGPNKIFLFISSTETD